MGDSWWLYMILCRGGGIYVGIARDVDARFKKHAAGHGAFYTRLNPPVELIARKEFASRREAAVTERALKRLSPVKKRRAAFSLTCGSGRLDGEDEVDIP